MAQSVERLAVNEEVPGSNPGGGAMDKNKLINLRNKIKETRKRKQITQGQLAKMVGTKQSSISRFENGNYLPNLFFLSKIANSLDSEVVIGFRNKVLS